MPTETDLHSAFDELQAIFKNRVSRSPMHRMAYSRDWSPRQRNAQDLPDLVVIPHSTDEVVQLVQIALRYNLPVDPLCGRHRHGRRRCRVEGRHHGGDQGLQPDPRD